MINHGRTLLLNVTGDDLRVDRAGEELIDSSYRALSLPNHLLTARRVLFGAEPDREMLNFRARQLLSLIHTCELVDLITDLDPRITYRFDDAPYYDRRMFVPVVTSQLTGTNNQVTAAVIGDAGLPDVSGKMRLRWAVEMLTASTVSVRPIGGLAATSSYSVSAGLTSPIPLPGAGLSLIVRDSTFAEGSGPRFEVNVLRRPSIDCGSLLATLEMIGTEALQQIFQGSAEPWPTLRNYWQKHFALPQRLGSFVLALIYKTEAIRTV